VDCELDCETPVSGEELPVSTASFVNGAISNVRPLAVSPQFWREIYCPESIFDGSDKKRQWYLRAIC
jgi:hypothetical protein